jgi:hypothetical protein
MMWQVTGLDGKTRAARQAWPRDRAGQRESAAARLRFELPRQGSNLDSSDPESDVLPVTPRGTVYGAEGARTPDLLGAIQALSQLSYSP